MKIHFKMNAFSKTVSVNGRLQNTYNNVPTVIRKTLLQLHWVCLICLSQPQII